MNKEKALWEQENSATGSVTKIVGARPSEEVKPVTIEDKMHDLLKQRLEKRKRK